MRFGWALAGALLLGSMTVSAEPAQELRVLAEHPVEGMRGGNLSGLALCGNALWTVSDRDDDQIYRLDTRDPVWQATAVRIDPPPVPDSGLPWGINREPGRPRSSVVAIWISKGSPATAPAIATLSAKVMQRCSKCLRRGRRRG